MEPSSLHPLTSTRFSFSFFLPLLFFSSLSVSSRVKSTYCQLHLSIGRVSPLASQTFILSLPRHLFSVPLLLLLWWHFPSEIESLYPTVHFYFNDDRSTFSLFSSQLDSFSFYSLESFDCSARIETQAQFPGPLDLASWAFTPLTHLLWQFICLTT